MQTFILKQNACTDAIQTHPITNGLWFLHPAEYHGENGPITNFVSLIPFNTRQIWNVYYFRFGNCEGWSISRNNFCFRMPINDFKKFFGDYEIIEEKKP